MSAAIGMASHQYQQRPGQSSAFPNPLGLEDNWGAAEFAPSNGGFDYSFTSYNDPSDSQEYSGYDDARMGGGNGYPPTPTGAGPQLGSLQRQPSNSTTMRSNNVTESVSVPTSEHVAEIVGRQGCKIKALRAKTGTYIKTPVRGEEPTFVVTGKPGDVEHAKREILSAADHFTNIRVSRSQQQQQQRGGGGGGGSGLGGSVNGMGGGNSPMSVLTGNGAGSPGSDLQTTKVLVPYQVVGLVVGPRGSTIKKIQQMTNTYIQTPSREGQPFFTIQGTPENVAKARLEIKSYIDHRTDGQPQQHGSGYEDELDDLRRPSRQSSRDAIGGGSSTLNEPLSGSLADAVNNIWASSSGGVSTSDWPPQRSSGGGGGNGAFRQFGVSSGGGRRGSSGNGGGAAVAAARQVGGAFDFSLAGDAIASIGNNGATNHPPLSQTRSEPIGSRGQTQQFGIGGGGGGGNGRFGSTSSGFASSTSINSPVTPMSAGAMYQSFYSNGDLTSAMSSSGTSGILTDASSGPQSGSNSGGNTPAPQQQQLAGAVTTAISTTLGSAVSRAPGSGGGMSTTSASSPSTTTSASAVARHQNKCSSCRSVRDIEVALVPCGHTLFCQDCASNMVEKQEPCPACCEMPASFLVLRAH